MSARVVVAFALAVACTARAHAAEKTPAPAEKVAPEKEREPTVKERLDELERKADALERSLLPHKLAVPSLTVGDKVKLKIGGYGDFGFFAPSGDGVAYVRDNAKRTYPQYASFPWVFIGDPWANPVNSQGQSADLGLDRNNLPRFDPIKSGGKSSFIVNTVNLSLLASVADKLLFETSINFEPRQGTLGSPGDYLDVDLAYLEYRPFAGVDLSFFLGKFESVFGIEYRRRKAPDHFEVTPSLLARYTTGTPTGVKVRGSVGPFTYAFSVTNGGSSTEEFAHFYNELDRNDFKTVAGRVSVGGKLGKSVPIVVEAGYSALYGAQDLQPDESLRQWQWGVDLRVELRDLAIRAEYLEARADGGGIANAPFLVAQGFYGEATYRFLPWLAFGARLDWRKARLYAHPNLYVSNVRRGSFALRFDITFNVIAKLEYLSVRELSGVTIQGDVFTSSLIFRF